MNLHCTSAGVCYLILKAKPGSVYSSAHIWEFFSVPNRLHNHVNDETAGTFTKGVLSTWLLVLAEGRGMPPVRVLVVEDYEPFRRFACSALEKVRKRADG